MSAQKPDLMAKASRKSLRWMGVIVARAQTFAAVNEEAMMKWMCLRRARCLQAIFATAMVWLFTAVNAASANETKCIYREGNFPLGPNEHFAGLFRVPLNPPDFRDREAIRRHLIFSETWTSLILKEVSNPAGPCGALALPLRFPDLRVFLKVSRTEIKKVDRERAYCKFVLEDLAPSTTGRRMRPTHSA
jgi:hypothetical protein